MGKKAQLIGTAAKLYELGRKVEEKREKIRKLVNAGYAYESPEILKALLEYQKEDEKWKQLEQKYLSLRDEISRQ